MTEAVAALIWAGDKFMICQQEVQRFTLIHVSEK